MPLYEWQVALTDGGSLGLEEYDGVGVEVGQSSVPKCVRASDVAATSFVFCVVLVHNAVLGNSPAKTQSRTSKKNVVIVPARRTMAAAL
jgi:hypothetical protein